MQLPMSKFCVPIVGHTHALPMFQLPLPRQLVEHALGKRMLVGSAGGFCRIKKMHKRSHSHTTTRAYCLDVGLL